MKRVFYGLLLTAASASALADPYSYQAEVRGSYGYTDADDSVFDGDDSYGLYGAYYFSPVKLKNHVYGEAAFLERAGSVSLSAGFSDNSHSVFDNCTDSCTNQQLNLQSQQYNLTSQGYILDSILYASATYSHYELDAEYSDGAGYSSSRSTWGAQLGVAPLEGWLLTTGFSEDSALFEHGWNVQSKYVGELGGDRAYNLEAAYTDQYGLKGTWSVGGDFYFTRSFSVGGSYSESDIYSLRAQHFFTPSVSLGVNWSNSEDIDSYSLALTGRF